jgi:hypothetical protein
VIGGVLWLVKPDPTEATAAPRAAPIAPRIAESIERKKMDALPAPAPVVHTIAARIEPEPVKLVMHEEPVSLAPAPRVHIRELNPRFTTRTGPRPARAITQKAPRHEHAIAKQEPASVAEAPVVRPVATVRTDFPY